MAPNPMSSSGLGRRLCRTHRHLTTRRRPIPPLRSFIKNRCFMFCLVLQVPGEGPDGHFPPNIGGFGPVPARIPGGLTNPRVRPPGPLHYLRGGDGCGPGESLLYTTRRRQSEPRLGASANEAYRRDRKSVGQNRLGRLKWPCNTNGFSDFLTLVPEVPGAPGRPPRALRVSFRGLRKPPRPKRNQSKTPRNLKKLIKQ